MPNTVLTLRPPEASLFSKSLTTVFMVVLQLFAVSAIADQNSKVDLQLLWKHQFQFAGYYQAIEQGFYLDEGIEVNLHEFATDRDPVATVIDGRADFAVGRSSIVVDYAQGKPIKALFAAFQRSPLMLLTRDDQGIHTPADLKGKKVMITSDAQANAEVMAMLLQAGLRSGDFTRQNHSFDLEDLIRGETDAMGSYLSNEPYQMMKKGLGYNILHPGSMGFEMYSDILFTSERLVRHQPELVERFRRASLKGWQYAFNNIPATAELIYLKYNTQQRTMAALIFEGEALRSLAYIDDNPIGAINEERFHSMASIYTLLNQMPSTNDLSAFIYRYDQARNTPLFTRSEHAYLEQLDKIRYCLDPNWLPYSGIVNNTAVGIDSEYVRFISSELNIVFELYETESWSDSLKALEDGRCDLLFSVMDTPGRRRLFSFTEPYRHVSLSLLVKAGERLVTGFNELAEKRVGIVEGDAYIDYINEHYPDILVQTFPDSDAGVKAVQQGRVLAMIAPYTTLAHLLAEADSSEMKIIGPMKEAWKLSVAVDRFNPAMVGILDKVLVRLSDEDHLNFAARWVSLQPVVSKSSAILWAGLAFLLLLIILLVFYFFRISRARYKGIAQLSIADPDLKQVISQSDIETIMRRLDREAPDSDRQALSIIVISVEGEEAAKCRYEASLIDLFICQLLPVQQLGHWYGGKYIILLPDVDQNTAMAFAGQLNELVDEFNAAFSSDMRCSFGVTSERSPIDVRRLVQFADYAAYEALLVGGSSVVYRSAGYTG